MTSIILVAVGIWGSEPKATLPTTSQSQAAVEDQVLTESPNGHGPTGDLRTRVADALRDTVRTNHVEPLRSVPRLVSVYCDLDREESLSTEQRQRLQSAVRERLRQIEDVLSRRAARSRQTRSNRVAASLAGGSGSAEAQELIDLIHATIDPQTWDVNGGRGSVRFYRPLNVLVVRQTEEVHQRLGGTLRQLRR